MKLVYRGVSYDYDPQAQRNVKPSHKFQPAYTLLYRGAVYTVDPSIESQQRFVNPIADLIYRGVAYSLNGEMQPETGAQAAPRPAATAQFDLASVHRGNLYRNVQRRLQAAQERGDQQLIHLLERELQQIA